MEKGKLFYKIHGRNFNKFLKTANEKGVEIFDLRPLEENEFSLQIEKKDENKFLRLLSVCNLKVVENKEKSLGLKIFKLFREKLSYIICLGVMLCGIFVSNFFVFKVEVYGVERIDKNEIIKVLEVNNFRVGKLKSSYNLDSLEGTLKNNIDNISLASCTIVGNTLVVNVFEKNYDVSKDFKPITASFDLIINNIMLESGTSNYSKGDVVKEKESIVEPFILKSDGKRLKVEAKAKIEAYGEKSVSVVYRQEHEAEVRSGRKQIFYDLNLWGYKTPKCEFDLYQIETKEVYLFKNFLLPIKRRVTIFWETDKIMVFEPFNDNIREKMIGENEKLLYNTFDGCLSVSEKKFSSYVEKVENFYIITTTISANVIF